MTVEGPGIEFGDRIADAVGELNESLNDHISTINDRLFDLEAAVFKAGGRRTDAEE
jgi:hypothetical protein